MRGMFLLGAMGLLVCSVRNSLPPFPSPPLATDHQQATARSESVRGGGFMLPPTQLRRYLPLLTGRVSVTGERDDSHCRHARNTGRSFVGSCGRRLHHGPTGEESVPAGRLSGPARTPAICVFPAPSRAIQSPSCNGRDAREAPLCRRTVGFAGWRLHRRIPETVRPQLW